MSKTKPNRMYHAGLDKYGDIIEVSNEWVTARIDGEKGTGCWEVDAPYIKIFIQEENLKPELRPEPVKELLKDKERLDWLIDNASISMLRKDDNGGELWLELDYSEARYDIDAAMEESQ